MDLTKEKNIDVDKLDNDNRRKKKLQLKLRFNTHNDAKISSNFNYRQPESISYNPYPIEKKSLYCYKNENDSYILFADKQIELPSSCSIIFRARKSKKEYYELISPILPGSYININYIDKLDKNLWFIFPTIDPSNKYENKNEEYYLRENDIIKFSKKKYEVSKLCINNRKRIEKENVINEINKKNGSIFNLAEDRIKISQDNKKDETKKFCKTCRGIISGHGNPLLELCECEIYIHFECLIKLLVINENKTNNNVTTYECETFNCEKCYKPYPTKFQVKIEDNYKTFSIIDQLEKPKDNVDYIIFESLTYIQKEKNIKNIYIIKLTEEKMTIGRKNENSIIIKDEKNTISGEHAILKYDKEKGVTIINKGMAGTLVLIKDNIRLRVGEKIYLQKMNTIFKAEVIEKIKQGDEDKGDRDESNDDN